MKTIEEVLQEGNSLTNQNIKAEFVGKHVYCNVNSLVEYCLNKGFEDTDSPINLDEIENYYSYPELTISINGRAFEFEGGSENDLEEFKQSIEDYKEELEEEGVFAQFEQQFEDAGSEIEELETEAAEVFEWWAVSSFLYEQLKDLGYCVADTGSCYVWGRTTTGQAILLDYAITKICAGMEILEGQSNSWENRK